MTLSLQSVSFVTDDPVADEHLAARSRLFLANQPLAALRRLIISARNGLVTVDGSVRSYYERQLAVACVQRVAGVRRVIDHIHVVQEAVVPQGECLNDQSPVAFQKTCTSRDDLMLPIVKSKPNEL